MSDRVQIPHTDIKLGGKDIEPKPAWWQDETGRVWMRCNCGGLLTLIDHDIDATGDVNPSILHPKEWNGCDWHVFAHLLDWDSGNDS